MALFVLADTHLSESLNKPMDVFGKRWNGYREKLIEGWRSAVSEEDTVVVPGDISWGISLEEAQADLRLLDSLPGTKLIGRGNHDYWWNSERKMKLFFAEKGISTLRLLHNNAYVYDRFLLLGSRGWYNDGKNSPRGAEYDKIVAREVIRIGLSTEAGKKLAAQSDTPLETLMFLHFPPVFRGQICSGIMEALHRADVKRCYFGHIHGVYDEPEVQTVQGIEMHLVSADYLSFVPKRIE